MRWILLITMGLLTAPVAFAQDGGVTWQAAYYDNGYLIGGAVAEETLFGRITQDWGTSSPADNIPADYFSARFTTTAYFPAGTWRFSVLADDAVGLLVDNQTLIDTIGPGSPAQTLVAEVTLSEGFHTVQLDYREAEGAAYVYLAWTQSGVDPLPELLPEISSVEAVQGRWTADFYNNTTLSPPIAFANQTPSPVANWGTDAPVPQVNPEGWSARFSTRIYLQGGRYRATLRADDGVRYYVDGRLLIDQFGGTQGRSFSAEFDLAEGEHDIVIEHVEYGGVASLSYSLSKIEPNLEPNNGGPPVPQPVPPESGTQPSIGPGAPPAEPAPQAATGDGVTATITARYLNIRSEPRVARGNIVATASSGQSFPVTGRANNGWVQLDVNGVRGWINGRYAEIPNLLSIPVTAQGPTS